MSLFKSCKDGVHKFEARYDEEPSGYTFKSAPCNQITKNVMIIKKYKHDICIKCGKIINKERI